MFNNPTDYGTFHNINHKLVGLDRNPLGVTIVCSHSSSVIKGVNCHVTPLRIQGVDYKTMPLQCIMCILVECIHAILEGYLRADSNDSSLVCISRKTEKLLKVFTPQSECEQTIDYLVFSLVNIMHSFQLLYCNFHLCNLLV